MFYDNESSQSRAHSEKSAIKILLQFWKLKKDEVSVCIALMQQSYNYTAELQDN